ncbi:MMPL family transporter [Angustibacter sp. McL0619]|uniref:MMPL family transporter n=1 Tax=Angustibacter sp. McL0619 TaxID=3415676 RepID=UPI003CF3E18F
MTLLDRLGRFEARHARLVALGWVAAIVVAFGLALGAFGGDSLFDRLTNGEPVVPGESRDGRDLLGAQHADGPQVVALIDQVDPSSPAAVAAVERLVPVLDGGAAIEGVASPYTVPGGPSGPAGRALVANDGKGVAVTVKLAPDLSRAQESERAAWIDEQVAATAAQLPGAVSSTSSLPQLVDEITHQVELDLRAGEGVALPVSLVVMVIVFGGFLAAGLPLAGAIASIAGGLASLWGFAHFIDLDATVVNVVTILGLGLCIDYGLLVVSRFREELRDLPWVEGEASADQVEAAVGRTVAIAGRTVLFSGLVVAISLSGLMLFQAQILRAVGAAGVSVVVVALLVALGFIPALLSLAGTRLVRPGLPARVPLLRRLMARLGDVAPPEGVFSRLARRVQRMAWPVAIGVTAVLLLAAIPALGMQLRSSGPDLMPVGTPQRTAFETVDARWPALAGPEVLVVTEGSTDQVLAWSADVAKIDGVSSVDPPKTDGSLVTLGVRVEGGDAGGKVATQVVRDLHAERPDFATWVVGQAAGQLDFSASLARTAPWAIGLVVLATFVLLFLMTGSVLVPVKALLMNLISLGAALGVVALIFQDGHLERLLSFTSTGGVETTIPPLVLAFGFGLAMDYEVFLLSRIKEQRDAGLPNDEAVAAGLQRSGRIITSAALLVIIVFAGLIAAKVLVVKQTGVALCVAVAIDATMVRMLLVPATMTLLGEWNWWAPAPLRRLHERIGIGTH